MLAIGLAMCNKVGTCTNMTSHCVTLSSNQAWNITIMQFFQIFLKSIFKNELVKH